MVTVGFGHGGKDHKPESGVAAGSCRNYAPLELPERWGPAHTLTLAQRDTFQTSDLQNGKNNKFVLFEATEFVAICYNRNRK